MKIMKNLLKINKVSFTLILVSVFILGLGTGIFTSKLHNRRYYGRKAYSRHLKDNYNKEKHHKKYIEKILIRLSESLNLTESQKTNMKSILEESRKEKELIKKEFYDKIKLPIQNTRNKMYNILDDKQKEIFLKLEKDKKTNSKFKRKKHHRKF